MHAHLCAHASKQLWGLLIENSNPMAYSRARSAVNARSCRQPGTAIRYPSWSLRWQLRTG